MCFDAAMPENAYVRQICENVARLLRKERERKRLSLAAVGKRAGLSARMIWYVERGQRYPSMNSFLRIASALEFDPVKILTRAEKLRG